MILKARREAARAISCAIPYEAEPQVIGECFSALLAIAPEYSLPFVAAYPLAKDEALQEFAAR